MGKIVTPPLRLEWSNLPEGYFKYSEDMIPWNTRPPYKSGKAHGKPTADNIRTVMLRLCAAWGMKMPRRARIVSQRKRDRGTVIAEYTFGMFEALP